MHDELEIAYLIRQGYTILCGSSYKTKLKLFPDYYQHIITHPSRVKDWSKVVIKGDMSDEERNIWRPYFQAGQSSW
jgi:hypothetical protein